MSVCPHASHTRTLGGGAIIRAAPRSQDATTEVAMRALYKDACHPAGLLQCRLRCFRPAQHGATAALSSPARMPAVGPAQSPANRLDRAGPRAPGGAKG